MIFIPQYWPARPGERNDFSKVTGEMTRVQNLFAFGQSQTAIKTSVGGQFSNDILPPSEQYLLGGTRYGRGSQFASQRSTGGAVSRGSVQTAQLVAKAARKKRTG